MRNNVPHSCRVRNNWLSQETPHTSPPDTLDVVSGTCHHGRGPPLCLLHSRDTNEGIFTPLPNTSRSGASLSSLQIAATSDSPPSVVTHSVLSISSEPHSDILYSPSPSNTSNSVYSSSSEFQLSVSQSFLSGSTALESSSNFLTPPASLLIPLHTLRNTQSLVPLPHGSTCEPRFSPQLRHAAAVSSTRAFPGLSDASVHSSVHLAAGSLPVSRRPPAILSCCDIDTRISKRFSRKSLSLAQLSPSLASSEPLLSHHDAPIGSQSVSPSADHLPATPPSDSNTSLLSTNHSSIMTSVAAQPPHSDEQKHSVQFSTAYSFLAPSCSASAVPARPNPGSAPPSLLLTRKTQVFSATSDLGTGCHRRSRRYTSLTESGGERQ